ncbi:MAG: hypothetical protein IT355_06135 [Gemmatimonadaceae bacterium]|nr:hypothetical protein [Gemmatimonadaceae bacterium]
MIAPARRRSTLRAPRIAQRVLVAADHPEPERVRRRLHDALQAHLPAALQARFAAASHRADDTVWRIRRLEIDLVVNASWEEADLAGAWATELARAVTHAIESGADGVTVMRFASPAAYLASFLTDLTNGTCWTKWWYGDFDGLRMLSRPDAIRTALLRDAGTGLAALATLDTADLALVTAQVTRQAARLLVEALGATLPSADASGIAALLLERTRHVPPPAERDDEERWVLRMLAEVARLPMAERSRDVVPLARAVARLATLTAEGVGRLPVIAHALRLGEAAALHAVAGSGDGGRLAPLVALPVEVRAVLVSRFTTPGSDANVAQHHAEPEHEWMPVAAPLLLADMARAMPFEEVADGVPGIGGGDDPPVRRATAAALLRLCVFATACGGCHAIRVLGDPVARRLAGVGVDVPHSALLGWIAGRSAGDATRLERATARWHQARGAIGSASWMLVQAAPGDGAPVTVLLDAARGHWLAVREGDGPDAADGLHDWIDGTVVAPAPAAVFCADRAQRDALHLRHPGRGCVMLPGVSGAPPLDAADTSDVAQALLRLDRLGDELDWIALPSVLQVPATMARALQVVAQGMLRSLAWRLPGFSRATLPHLWANFLSVDAQVLVEEQRVVATLSRPPLAMIVSMTGLFHARYSLPWMSPPLVMLFPAEGA